MATVERGAYGASWEVIAESGEFLGQFGDRDKADDLAGMTFELWRHPIGCGASECLSRRSVDEVRQDFRSMAIGECRTIGKTADYESCIVRVR